MNCDVLQFTTAIELLILDYTQSVIFIFYIIIIYYHLSGIIYFDLRF